jgi:hypothetical protein
MLFETTHVFDEQGVPTRTWKDSRSISHPTRYFLAQNLLRPQLNLNAPVIFHDDMHPLIAARTALIKSTIFLGIRVATCGSNQMSRSIVRSIPSRNIRIGDLSKL